MSSRPFGSAGWKYMRRVWCPRCGFSFLTGRGNPATFEADTDRPVQPCRNPRKCKERQQKKEARASK